MESPKADVLPGTLVLLVLRTLDALGPLHGYGIARRIEQISATSSSSTRAPLSSPPPHGARRLDLHQWGASKRTARRSSTPSPPPDAAVSPARPASGVACPAPSSASSRSTPRIGSRSLRDELAQGPTARVLALFTRSRFERQLDDEVRFHLDMEMTPTSSAV